MRAAVVRQFGPSSNIIIDKSWPKPEISDNQILVKVKSVGVNPYEVHIREGTYSMLPELPYVPGGEGSGIVEKVGNNIKKFKSGDLVWFIKPKTGSCAEYAVVEETVFNLPKGVSFSQGAALGVAYITAYRAIFLKGQGLSNQTIFIHGASGGVGIASVQLAHALGLRVIGTAGTEDGLRLVKENGAVDAFNHRDSDYVQKIKAKYPQGFDIILEMLANQNLNTDADLIAKAGRIVVIGSRGISNVDARKIMSKEATITGVARLLTTTTEQYLEWGQKLTDLLAQGKLNPIVGAELPLEKLAEAHDQLMDSSKSSHGKLVIKID